MRFNWKTAAAGLVALALLVVFIPYTTRDNAPDGEMRSTAELQYKQQLLEQDVKMTEKLCRNQCRLDIQQMLGDMTQQSDTGETADSGQLSHLQKEHPHMRYLEMRTEDRVTKQGDVGKLPDEVAPYIELARDNVKANRSYESPRIITEEGPYFVIGVRSRERDSYVISAVKQQILDQIRIDQRKNLRLVPYPSDARFGIQAADSDTLNKVDVDHPEENENVSHYYMNDIVVRFASDPDERELARIRQEIDADWVDKAGYAYVFRSKSLTAEQLMEYFGNGFDIHYVEPHYLYVTNGVPNDALYEQYQWNLPAIRTESGWDLAWNGDEVIVAVIDTGVDSGHPEFANRLVTGYNVYTGGSDATDDVGHGTHVAGIIAAEIDNYEGIAGIAPNSRIMPVKVLDGTGAGSTYAVAEGIIWATDNGAQVINLSLGNYAEAQFLHDAIRYAYDRNVVLVAATGNDNTETPGYPAAYDEVFAVGATDSGDKVAQFSNYGSYLDVSAPGVSIASTYPGNQYAALSGTSMASPHVAALAAMIRSVNPALSNEEVMELMRATSVDLGESGHDIYYGHGRVDVVQALNAATSSGQSVVKWGENLQRGLKQIISKYE